MIRVAWYMRDNPEILGYGSWFQEGDRYMLQEWVISLQSLYPDLYHFIEHEVAS
jgi:hypothetical protein